MSKYASFNLDTVRALLCESKGWTEVTDINAKEHVFEWRVNGTPYAVRVYTSVQKSTGWTRGCGEDAIRVCVPKRLKSRRIHRTEGWQDRLKTRVRETVNILQDEARSRAAAKLAATGAPVESLAKPQMPNILAMMHAAKEKLQYPKVNFDHDGVKLRLHVAGDKSKTPGQVALTDGGQYPDAVYYGRIDLAGNLQATKACTPEIKALLTKIEQDPAKAAAEIGFSTGHCCFCKKELSTPESLAAGYGPTCAVNFHLPWGAKTNA